MIDNRKLIKHNDQMYLVKRIIPEIQNPIVPNWKEYLNCDIVLKANGSYFFCNLVTEITDAEFISV